MDMVQKNKKLLGIICILVVLIAIFAIFLMNNSNKDPFEKVYLCQTQDDTRQAMGTPDYVDNPRYTNKGSYVEGKDEYHDISFLGEKGNLSIYFKKTGDVEYAVFNYYYPSGDNYTPKEVDNAKSYAMKIVEFYTNMYGEPEIDDDEYCWQISDNQRIRLYTSYSGGGSPVMVFLNFD